MRGRDALPPFDPVAKELAAQAAFRRRFPVAPPSPPSMGTGHPSSGVTGERATNAEVEYRKSLPATRIETRGGSIELRAMDKGPGEIIGYAAVYEVESRDLGFIETIARGAFDNADLSDVIALRDHDRSQILGRVASGTLTVTADGKGLRYAVALSDTQTGRDLAVLVERGDVRESSFSFRAKRDEWTEKDEKDYRRILEIEAVFDVSPVTSAAYPGTSVGIE